MSVFGKEYAKAYDYLYQDKDYKEETDFIEGIFEKHSAKIKTVLDLGCGTGGHALILAESGYEIAGVDRSAEMVAIAEKKAEHIGLKVGFHESSIQDLDLHKEFDAVISMFAVMGYQIDNNELALACKTARQHLKPDGVFIFDAWNGMAVMSDPPTQRVKEVNIGDERIIRITDPRVDIMSHTVDVNFNVLKFRGDRLISETEESHKMRFLFPQEIKYFLEVAGFRDIQFCPFLKPGRQLQAQDWDMTVIAM